MLDTISRSLEVLLGGAVAANQLPIVASFVDFTTDGFVPASSTNETNNATPVTAVAAPANASTQRQIKFLTIRNADSAPATATLRFNDNSTMRVIWAGVLAVGDSLLYTDGEGLRVIDTNGQVKQTGGGGSSDHAVLSHLSWAASGHTGTANRFPHFDGSGAAELVAETGSGSVVRDTSPTIVTPTIASLTNTQHNHQNAAGGGTLDAAAIASGTVATARLGSGTANNGTFLRGDQTWATAGSADVLPGTCGGRLTLTSGTPITTGDVTGASTVYFTPYLHSRVALYNGSAWILRTFTERSLSLTLTTGKNYDIFLYDNSGTLTLELSAAWTNDTTRADALTTQDGVYVKDGATNKLYVGTIRASGTNTTEDSLGGAHQSGGKRFVWNTYNRVLRPLAVIDTTNEWTYTTATWRQANGATGNKVEYVSGLGIECMRATAFHAANTGASAIFQTGVGVDSATTNSARMNPGATSAASFAIIPMTAIYLGYPGMGYHVVNWLEISQAAGTTTWRGDCNVSFVQSGLQAEVWA